MGWSTDDGKHEGWEAPLFADGAIGGGYTGDRVLVHHDGQGRPLGDRWEERPDSEVVGWVAACECGWRGEPWQRVAPGAQNLDRRLAYSPDAFAPDRVEEAAHDEWLKHVAPERGLAAIREAAVRRAQADRELEEAVRSAQSAGASWAKIGEALGISRQSAHERFARVTG